MDAEELGVDGGGVYGDKAKLLEDLNNVLGGHYWRRGDDFAISVSSVVLLAQWKYLRLLTTPQRCAETWQRQNKAKVEDVIILPEAAQVACVSDPTQRRIQQAFPSLQAHLAIRIGESLKKVHWR